MVDKRNDDDLGPIGSALVGAIVLFLMTLLYAFGIMWSMGTMHAHVSESIPEVGYAGALGMTWFLTWTGAILGLLGRIARHSTSRK